MILSILSLLLSCEKENNTIDDKISDPYELPWKTEYVHYENISMCMGSHSSGYELYYKDSLLKEDCADFGGIGIQDSMLINDSILHLFFSGSNGSYVLTTTNGGYAWEKFETGPPSLQKLHYVNTKLTYCVTKNQDDLYFTGIGKSYLSVYHQTFSSGIHYITDQGTEVMNNDSATIEINDSLSFVILF